MQKIDKDVLAMDANHIEDSLNGLQALLDYKLSTDMTTEDIDQINSIVVAIKLLAKKHVDDIEQF